MDDLEVLDGGLSDASVEVENVRSRLVVPHRRLVVELNHVIRVPVLVSSQ